MIKKIISSILIIIFYPIKKIIPKSNIIVLGTFSRQVYRDNTRYLFEYLSEKQKNKIYWITDNKNIKSYLKQKNYNYVSTYSPLHMLWILLRAKIIIDSGTNYFNPFKIMDSKNTIKITTQHGNGPKANFSRSGRSKAFTAIQQIKNLLAFDYVNYPSDYSIEHVGKKAHLLPNEKLINLGYPRCDHFFDKEYVNLRHHEKMITKSLFNNFKAGSKIIFYTPTWRPYEFKFPLFEMNGFDQKLFNQWLRKYNCYFVYSIHTTLEPQDRLDETDRVCFLDLSKDPFLDVNNFMMEVDILLNDYSTTSTEFAILNRPQIFFIHDYEKYLKEKGFIEDYKKIMPGNEVKSLSELLNTLNEIFDDGDKYIDKYNLIQRSLVEKYYNIKNKNSSENFSNFIDELLSQNLK